MALEYDTDYCVLNFPSPVLGMGNEQYEIVQYGETSESIAPNIIQQGTTIAGSPVASFKFTGSYSGSTVYLASSRTTSEVNLGIPETAWFLNDKTNRTIVFPSLKWPTWVMTETCSSQTELPNIGFIKQFVQASQKIARFANYSENWDSYGAKCIDKDCIIMGFKIFRQLIDLISSVNFEVPAPFVAPLSSGGIQMEWERGDRYLEISITPNPIVVEYFAVDQAKGGQLSLEGYLQSLSFLKELISWFVKGTSEDLSHISFGESYEECAI